MQKIKETIIVVIALPVLILVVPVLLAVLIHDAVAKIHIRKKLLNSWPEGKFILFTYSDSPNWAQYIEANILPKIEDHSIIINRTKYPDWKSQFKTEKRAVELWASLKINPLAIIFTETGKVKIIEFYDAFRDLKHGKEQTINSKCEELMNALPNTTITSKNS